MSNFLNKNIDMKTMSPLTLAFIGDGVYELFVREYLVGMGNCPVKKLNAAKVDFVRCEFQAKIVHEILMPIFTEEETDVFMRGRNAHVSHIPKNSQVSDYHAATGFESVFGYLYMQGKTERLNEFFSAILASIQ